MAAVVVQRAELTRTTARLTDQQATAAAEAVANLSDAEVARSAPGLNAFFGHEYTLVEVVGARGSVLAASAGIRRGAPLLPRPAGVSRPALVLRDVESRETDRYVATAAPVGDGGRYVVAATSLESVDAATASTTRLLLWGAPTLVLVVAGLGWWLAGRALRPVEEMRARASEIGATDLTRRLPVGSGDDEVSRLGATLNDLLARVEASQSIQRRFAADASHELRSPIAAVRTLLEVARTDPEVDWDQVSALALAENLRLERLATDLLVLARLDAQPERSWPRASSGRHRFDLAGVVRREAARARRVEIVCECDGPLTVEGSAEDLGRVLRNLLDNAARHAARRVSVSARSEAGRAVVHVRDDGPGVGEHQRERVFERFVRLDDSRARDAGGAGLGLAIAREVVVRHDGTIGFVGDGPGADVEVSLPLCG